MAEITTAITLRYTVITNVPDNELEKALSNRHTADNYQQIAKDLKHTLGLDDVNVLDIQDFVMDKPE